MAGMGLCRIRTGMGKVKENRIMLSACEKIIKIRKTGIIKIYLFLRRKRLLKKFWMNFWFEKNLHIKGLGTIMLINSEKKECV